MSKVNKTPHLSNVYNAGIHIATAFGRYILALENVGDRFKELKPQLNAIIEQLKSIHNETSLLVTSHRGDSADTGRKKVHQLDALLLAQQAEAPTEKVLSPEELLFKYEDTLADEVALRNMNPRLVELYEAEIKRLRALGVKAQAPSEEKVFLKGIL